jgi:hypothetical protein
LEWTVLFRGLALALGAPCLVVGAACAALAATGVASPPQRPESRDLLFQDLGAGHVSVLLSSPYSDGGRVLWTSGEEVIAKIDAATFDVIATLRRPGAPSDDGSRRERLIALLDSDRPAAERRRAAASDGWHPAASAGSLLDPDNRLLVPEGRSIAAYGDAEPGARLSGIRVAQRFTLPASIPGTFGRLGLTRDGHIVATTSAGVVVALARGFSRLTTVVLPHAPGREDGAGSWVRGGPVVDDRDGIYVATARHLHRIAWNGSDLSVAETAGAWSEPLQGGLAEGATPAFLGAGEDGDRLVAIVAGEPPSLLTLLWRDDLPAGASGGRSGRIAAVQEIAFGPGTTRSSRPANLALVIHGNGLLAAAASAPLPLEPSPGGLAKWIWDPRARTLRAAWSIDTGAVSGAPVVTPDGRGIWFVAFRDGRSALEGIDWESGAPLATRPLGGARFLAPGAPLLDPAGRFVAGSLFGVMRIGFAR